MLPTLKSVEALASTGTTSILEVGLRAHMHSVCVYLCVSVCVVFRL